MKQKLFYLVAVSISLILTGCMATHVGNMSGSASLNSPNFMYKKQNISGEAKATYVLGLGGNSRQSLITDAKKSMLKENPLLKNQALANVAVSYKTTYFLGLVVVVKCNTSADIVEFGTDQNDLSISQSQNPTIVTSKKAEIISTTPVKVGDRVKIINYFSNPVDGEVTEVQNGTFTVEYTNSNNKTRTVKVLEFQVQKIE